MEKRPHSSRDEYPKSFGHSRNDGYSRNDNYSRNDSYSNNDGYARSNSYGKSDSYSRNDGFSRDNRVSRGDNHRGRGGYNSRGRGGGRYQSGGFGAQNSDNWQCSSCRFSNYATRSNCYKCHNAKDDDYQEPRTKWGKSDSSSRGRSSWNSSSQWGNRNSQDSSAGASWNSSDSSNNKEKESTRSTEKDDSDDLIDWDEFHRKSEEYEKTRFAHLPDIIKNMYKEDPDVKDMTTEEVKTFRENSFGIEVTSSNPELNPIPNPVTTFEQAFASYPMILAEIKKQGFENPSPIQCQAWPILLKGIDMIGTSQTGSGKTLAFLLPALLHIVAQPTPRWQRIGPTCLVLAPTRELAQQIEREVNKFEYENIRCVCIYGQGDKRNQIQKLNAMSEIVIATPGRLNDFVSQRIVDLSGVSYLVLDEADRMLDMGFEPQVKKIVMDIRPDRQTILTSATWPEDVRSLADKLMKDPIHVVVGSLDLQAVDTITQNVIICDAEEKQDKLMQFVKKMKGDDKAIVFVGQKITVDHLSVHLTEAGIYAESMHGGRCQEDREHALRQLKSGRARVLIATDVAARGIDIQDITHVFNYDCPKDMEEYVHRVGRTGRAGRSGESCTLICREDWKVAGKLIEILEKSDQNVPEELRQMKNRWDRAQAERGGGFRRNGNYGGGPNRNGWWAP